MNKPFYIIDASVILKWFFEKEEYQKQALAIQEASHQQQCILGIPDYCYAETLNILGRKFPRKQILSALSFLFAFDMRQHEITLELAFLAMEIMEEFPGVSFYDAGYHALALLENGTFITADKEYFSKTKKKGNIMFLKDYVLG